MKRFAVPFALVASILLAPFAHAAEPQQWVVYEGKDGPGKGKQVVLVAGDEEYRSEEYMPVLGKILAERHGFRATVLFPVDKATGQINPKTLDNIPGLEALDSADLMIIGTRFRALPDEQMKHVDDYLKAGKPVIGMRTATHAFNGLKTPYDVYNNGYKGEKKEWADGFGRLVLGERWVSHHGEHKKESTRAMIAPEGKGSPLLNGIKDGEIWTPTDVYGVRLPLPGDSKPLLLGQVVKRSAAGEPVAGDPFYGMSPDDREPAAPKLDKKTNQTLDKNNPMMPVAWTKSYQLPGGKPGKAFATTMGSAADVTNEGLRRLIVNAAYSLTGLAVPERADVGIVGEFKPTAFGFNGFKAGMKPGDFQK